MWKFFGLAEILLAFQEGLLLHGVSRNDVYNTRPQLWLLSGILYIYG
jgi:hypothetical protein